MAALHDATTTRSQSSADFIHTPVGTPTAAIFFAMWRGGDSTSDLTAVTYGGNAMTQKIFVDAAGNSNGPTSRLVSEIWVLEDPPSGAQTVSITRTGTAPGRHGYTLTTVTGSPTSSTFGTPVSANLNSATATSVTTPSLTSATDELCIDGLTTEKDETHTADASQTERWQFSPTSALRCVGSTEPGAASVVMGWSWTTVTRYAYTAIPIKSAAAFTDAIISAGVGTDDINIPINVDTHDDINTDHSDLYRSTSSPASAGSVIQNDIVPTQSSIIIDNAANSTSAPSPDTIYFYMLRDFEDAGELVPHDSNEFNQKTAPARPTAITLVETQFMSIKISWTDQTADVYGHRVFYRLKSDTSWIGATPGGVNAGIDEYTVGNLLSGVYEFHVRAWNKVDNLSSGFTQILEAATETELRTFQCDTFQYDAFQVREPSFVRPTSDVAVGNWTDELAGVTDIFGSIDEDPAVDSDYITTLVVATDDIYRFRLEPVGDRPCDQGYVLQYRIEKEGAGTVRMIFNIIKEDLTVVVTKTHTNVVDAITEDKIELTATQVATLKAANWFASPLVQVTADNGT